MLRKRLLIAIILLLIALAVISIAIGLQLLPEGANARKGGKSELDNAVYNIAAAFTILTTVGTAILIRIKLRKEWVGARAEEEAAARIRLVNAEQAFVGNFDMRVPQPPATQHPLFIPEDAEGFRRDLRDEQDARPPDPLSLTALWEVTHSRLDYYHQIATGQADRSFRNAQRAMSIGFGLMVVFAALAAFLSRNAVASVVAGSLGAVSAGFAAYISRTFVRSQESAATHLRSYFNQPLEFSRYLAAERMLNSLKDVPADQRGEITQKLLLSLFSVSPPAPEGAADKPGASKPDAASDGAK
ncbi:hypothetical protein [Actinomadura bangladeshensis]|uniref:Uncharacterized protein n=1 Tax=Actinomadura bangladeshensis TaxID=453573 RepID=A0A6L9QIK9_9ACTN|nr:hypothetical protein [Actinomadura bangladeshensis]NEA23894.1 hypothetical protein [Actinomadura bangladeshensis]